MLQVLRLYHRPPEVIQCLLKATSPNSHACILTLRDLQPTPASTRDPQPKAPKIYTTPPILSTQIYTTLPILSTQTYTMISPKLDIEIVEHARHPSSPHNLYLRSYVCHHMIFGWWLIPGSRKHLWTFSAQPFFQIAPCLRLPLPTKTLRTVRTLDEIHSPVQDWTRRSVSECHCGPCISPEFLNYYRSVGYKRPSIKSSVFATLAFYVIPVSTVRGHGQAIRQ